MRLQVQVLHRVGGRDIPWSRTRSLREMEGQYPNKKRCLTVLSVIRGVNIANNLYLRGLKTLSGWRNWIARMTSNHEVAGSSPV
jgi:hypothetical protein